MTEKLLTFRAEGADSAPPLLLGPSLGTSYALWDKVAPELSLTHRVIRWDLPGHGGSAPGLIGPGATVGDLADLVLALADSLGVEQFAYAGVSLGGAVGLHLAVHHPERVASLAVICSSAHFNGAKPWEERAARVRSEGLGWLVESANSRWFTPGFTVPELVADQRDADPGAYAACCDALAGFDLRERLPEIGARTLAVAGREDPATPPTHLREIADAVPGAALVEIPGPLIWRPHSARRPFSPRCGPTSAVVPSAGWRSAVRSSATPMWIGPRPGRRRSPPGSRTSSRGTRGVRSGPIRRCRGASGA